MAFPDISSRTYERSAFATHESLLQQGYDPLRQRRNENFGQIGEWRAKGEK